MSAKELLTGIQANLGKLAKVNPGLAKSFMQDFVPKSLADGALTHREKELIALGIAIQSNCDYCIAMHVKKALDAGISKEEIGEVCGVAVLMGGGPALMYSARAMEILDELTS